MNTETTPTSLSHGYTRRSIVVLGITSVVTGLLLLLLLSRLIAAGNTVASAPVSPVVGHPAPDFTIHTWTYDGSPSQTIHLAALKGHPVVVNFWASWCESCKEEEPLLESAWQKYRAQGVIFIGVAFDDTQPNGTAFLKQYGITFPSGPDTNGSIAVDYGLTGVPETAFISRDGTVVQKAIGILDDGTLNANIQQILR